MSGWSREGERHGAGVATGVGRMKGKEGETEVVVVRVSLREGPCCQIDNLLFSFM